MTSGCQSGAPGGSRAKCRPRRSRPKQRRARRPVWRPGSWASHRPRSSALGRRWEATGTPYTRPRRASLRATSPAPPLSRHDFRAPGPPSCSRGSGAAGWESRSGSRGQCGRRHAVVAAAGGGGVLEQPEPEHGGAQHSQVVGASALAQRAPRTPADRPSLRLSRPVLGGSGSRLVLGGGGRGSRPWFSLTRAGRPSFPGGRCSAAPEGRPRGLAASGLVGSRAERSEESTKLGSPRGPPRVFSVAKNSHSEPKCFRVAETSKLLVNLKG